jgi:hypothetical protein
MLSAAVETASVIITMMMASNFMKLSATSLIALESPLVLEALARVWTLQRACRRARVGGARDTPARKSRLFKELIFRARACGRVTRRRASPAFDTRTRPRGDRRTF